MGAMLVAPAIGCASAGLTAGAVFKAACFFAVAVTATFGNGTGTPAGSGDGVLQTSGNTIDNPVLALGNDLPPTSS
jgi:hypothetical protein